MEHFFPKKGQILGDKRQSGELCLVSLFVGVSASSHSGSTLPSLFWRQRLSKPAAAASSLLANANRHLLLLSRRRLRVLAEHLATREPATTPHPHHRHHPLEGPAQSPSDSSDCGGFQGGNVRCQLTAEHNSNVASEREEDEETNHSEKP